MKILDIDLDFFLNNKHCGTVTNVTRLSDEEYIPWSPEAVEKFLEDSCGLSKTNPVDGIFFTHHDEVFFYLRSLQEQSNFSLRFSIDHLDAHADLGSGDTSYIYLAQDILSRPLKDRPYPDKMNGWEGLSAGNYLIFIAAANGLIKYAI